MLILIFIGIYFFSANAITYDSGIFYGFDYTTDPDFNCLNQYSKLRTILFSGTFDNPPQVMLISEITDITYTNVKYFIEIQSITKTQFNLYILCSFSKVFSVGFRWYAIDDQRVQVINLNQIQNKTYPQNNPNAVKGFVSLLSIGYNGTIDFEISVTSITADNFTVTITDPSGCLRNITAIGYQVILVPKDFINIYGTINQNTNYASDNITLRNQSWFLTPRFRYQHFNYLYNIRLKVEYSSYNPINYIYTSWDGFTGTGHQQIWFQYNLKYKAMFGNNIRISRTYDPLIINQETIQFGIQGTQVLISTNGIATINLPNFETFIFFVQGKCVKTQKYIVKIFFCPACPNETQNTILSQNCYGGMNKLVFYLRFKQQSTVNQYIQVTKTSSTLQVLQILYNQETTNVTLIDVKVQNI